MPERRFCLLVHQLPPRPLYLRAQVRQRLAKVGAVALKNSVYALPLRDDCLEDLQWIAQEAAAGGGDAFVCEARFVSGIDAAALLGRFNALRDADYRRLLAELRRQRGPGDADAWLGRLRKRLAEIAAIDFFEAPARKQVEREMKKLERRNPQPPARAQAPSSRELRGRTWVTRQDPHVDRLASAWLIRRFVDPRARFRFVDPRTARLKPRELGFDMPGGSFTHEGARCTFEVLVHRLGLGGDPALKPVADIVHDIDLKDERFSRPETDGVRSLLAGLYRTTPRDAERLERGVALFDDLYQSFKARART